MTYERGQKPEPVASTAPILGDQNLPETQRIETHLAELRQLAKQIAWGHAGIKHLLGIDLAADRSTLLIVSDMDHQKKRDENPPALCRFPSVLRDAGVLDQAVKIGNLSDTTSSEKAKLLAQLYVDNREAICTRFEAFVYTVLENAFLSTHQSVSNPEEAKSIERRAVNKPGEAHRELLRSRDIFHQYAQEIEIDGKPVTKLYIFDWKTCSPSERSSDLQIACEQEMFLQGEGISNEIPSRDDSWRTRSTSARTYIDGQATRHSSTQFAPMGTIVVGDLKVTGEETPVVENLDDLKIVLRNKGKDHGTIYKIDPLTTNRLARREPLAALEFDDNLQNIVDNRVARNLTVYTN